MKTLTYIKYMLLIAIIASSCTSEKDHDHATDHDPNMGDEISDNLISINEKQFESSDFQLGKIEKHLFNNFLSVNGSTHLPEKNKAAVSSFVGGSVGSMELIHGQWVKRGQQLFTISNPELISWQQDYLVLQSELDYQQSEYERQKMLSAENIAAKKNLKQAESILNVTKAKLAGLSKKLSMIGVSPSEISESNLVSALGIFAPSSGYITEINVKRGMFLEPFKTAMEISNTNHLHMELKVQEKDIPKIKNGQMVQYSLQDDPSKLYEASVYLIEKQVEDNRMVNVHCHLEEEQEKALIPGMFVTAQIVLDSKESYAIAKDAVVAFDGEYFVLEHRPNSKYDFDQVEVGAGIEQNGYYQLENIKALDTSATYLINGTYYLIKGEGGGHSH